MGKKINDTGEFPNTTPAADDFVLGVDVSNTSSDANGEVVTFTIEALRGGALVAGANISELTNDAGYITEVTEDNVTAHEAALTITESQISDLGAYITDLLSDTTPQLGGNLDVNGSKIVSTSDGDIDIEPNGTGNVLLGNFTFDADQTVGAGQDDYVLTYDHAAGTIALEEAGGGGGGLVPISKTTASAGDAALDIDLSGGYSGYRLRILKAEPQRATGDNLILYVSTDGGSTFKTGASDYAYMSDYANVQTTGTGLTSGDADSTYLRIPLSPTTINDAPADALFGVYDVFPGDATRNFHIIGFCNYGNASSYWSAGQIHARYNTVGAVDAIRIQFSFENIESLEVHLYGIADGA